MTPMSYTQNKYGQATKVNDRKRAVAPSWLSRWQFAVMRRMQQAAYRGRMLRAVIAQGLRKFACAQGIDVES